MRRLLHVIAIGVCLWVLTLAMGFGYVWYQNTYRSVVQTAEVPDADVEFVLMTNLAGMGDQTWTVYRRPLGAPITSEMRDALNTDGVLFWNYAESGAHTEGARLDVVGGRFLVFTRGGLRHSLYDIAADSVLVNVVNPWGESLDAFYDSTRRGPPPSLEEEDANLDVWVRDSLDARIGALLRGAV